MVVVLFLADSDAQQTTIYTTAPPTYCCTFYKIPHTFIFDIKAFMRARRR